VGTDGTALVVRDGALRKRRAPPHHEGGSETEPFS
jgi:hypothetical protein